MADYDAWTPEQLDTAKRVLGTCESLAEAAAVLEAHIGRPCSRDSIGSAFKRAGMPTPGTFLKRAVAPPVEPDMQPAPIPDPPAEASPPASPPIIDFQTWVVLSDIHVPFQNIPFVNAALQLIADIRPYGIILNGDVINFDEISRHSMGSVGQLEGKRFAHSIIKTNELLDRLDAALGDTCRERVWHDGNHESNVYRWMMRGDNAVFLDDPLLSLPERLRLRERGYLYKGNYPNAHTKIGKLLVTHGQYVGKYPAARHMEKYQVSTLVGHVHTEQTYAASTWDEPRISFTQGHMADEDSEGMDYYPRPRQWISSFSVVHVRPNGMFHRLPVQWVDGCLFYGSQAYPRAPHIAGCAR